MRRILFIVGFVILSVAGFNIFFFIHLRKVQLDYQKDVLMEQTLLCGERVEKIIAAYESDLNRIIFRNIKIIHTIFSSEREMRRVTRELEGFYSKYRDLITNISVYDNQDRYLGVYINEVDEFVIDTFARQQQNALEPRDMIVKKNGRYFTYFPYFENNSLRGNIVVEINLEKYVGLVFELYLIEGIQWQWIINTEGEVLFTNSESVIEYTALEAISDSIFEESYGIIEADYRIDGKHSHVINAYYPLNVLNNDLGVVFSTNTTRFTRIFNRNSTIYILLSGLILLGLIFYLIRHLSRNDLRERGYSGEVIRLNMILEQFPIGIMITDKDGVIRTLNRTGQKMLFVKRDEDIIGKKLDEQFMVPNKYLLKEGMESGFDENHFIHYVKDGNEIVIYRKDNHVFIAGEELTISALVDVSPLEKSRKQEAAANVAKSDFLARMSHEIRTPMNGIISMTDSLMKTRLSPEQSEMAVIIRKSSDLLMNVINDVLDFSKIEAGKLMLEEIPFNLEEEVNLSLELFRPLAKEKNLTINFDVKPDVPSRLIGDPFRLRQVINNLLSNSVKFTETGFINLNIRLAERAANRLSLLVSVEDTGIGIEKEALPKIFARYEQARATRGSIYGGTGLGTSIARQLVEMMNGEIWVESPSGLSSDPRCPGSRFSFTLELHSDEKHQKKIDFSAHTSLHKVTALILSGIKDNTDQVHRVLDSFGVNFVYRLFDEKSLDSTIYHITQHRDLYQFIILKDKPGHSAFPLAQKLYESRLYEHFPLIMISSADAQGNYLKSRNLGVDHYLIQPYEPSEILAIVNEYFPGVKNDKALGPLAQKIPENLRILVAEDNLINQRVVQAIFKHLGYEVSLAGNGSKAVEMLRAQDYDIVFMDLIMPEMDGITAVRAIRQSDTTIPMIAMDAATNEDDNRKEAEKAGFNDFIEKPVRAEAVKALLIKWFSRSGESDGFGESI
jgi:signal transduction histidine kinase/CheY-like chemotaxis protein